VPEYDGRRSERRQVANADPRTRSPRRSSAATNDGENVAFDRMQLQCERGDDSKALRLIFPVPYRWRLWRLKAEERSTLKRYSAARVAAKKSGKGRDVIDNLLREEQFECSIVIDQIAQLKTGCVLREASRYDVPVRWDGDDWEESGSIGGRQLTTKGFFELQTAIRKEKNERWAYWELRMKVIVVLATAMTGAVGALIGLVATLKK
jgi:hypothetical protein